MKTWKEFLHEKSDGKKPYSELTKDYYLYMQQEDVPSLKYLNNKKIYVLQKTHRRFTTRTFL